MPEMESQTATSTQAYPKPLVKPVEVQSSQTTTSKKSIVVVIIGTIILGIITGYFLTMNQRTAKGTVSVSTSTDGSVAKGKIYGSNDESLFKDQAEGAVQKGGIDNEGTHKLIRPGGDSQTVCLTSSTIDLDQFVDRKVKVWGATQAHKKCGWFMDVGRLEVE